MAFPVPQHLPRATPQDVTSKILSRMDEATAKPLNASLANSWLEELDATIQSTKERIHDRIHADFPEFERQLQSAGSVQTRLRTLTTEVDYLNHSLSDPNTGLVPSLLKSLTTHSVLAQETTNARGKHEALVHLSQCRKEYSSLVSLAQAGDLTEAVGSCGRMEQLLKDAPVALAQSNVFSDLTRKFNATKARTEEQLSDAYSRSVLVTPHELTINASVQVRQSERTLALPDILSSSSSASLAEHLNTLRRDITTHYIDALLTQPMSVVEEDAKITCFPSPPNDEVISLRIDNLYRTLQFLRNHLFVHIPTPQNSTFLRNLCKPVSSSMLNNLLIPNLPSSFDRLPAFLELLKGAVAFEESCIIDMLGNDPSDRSIKSWADGVGGHYERQRRVHILDDSRRKILEPDNFADTFQVEVEVSQPVQEPEVVPVQDEVVPIQEEGDNEAAWGFGEEDMGSATKVDEEGWGFDEDVESSKKAEDSWGFDDESADPSSKADDSWGLDEATEEAPDEPTELPPEPPLDSVPETNGHDADPDDAWGWNGDDKPGPAEETSWDDPWEENASAPPPALVVEARPPPAPSIKSPKIATRLEKLANKGKKGLNGNSPMNSPLISTPRSPNPSSSPAIDSPVVSRSLPQPPPPFSANKADKEKRPPNLSFTARKETYVVSARMKDLLSDIRDTLREGREFTDSHILLPNESSSAPGTTLLQTSASIVDIYRALYPVVFHAQLQSLEGPMRFSNNCLYLSKEIEMIGAELRGSGFEPVKGRLRECEHALKVLGESWYGDTIEKQRQLVDTILTDGTQGFTFTGDQDRYDECESAMNRVLQEIRRIAQKWKGILTKSKSYTALGSVMDAALSRVLQDILGLDDIPELESHRLSELCRIFLALEGLFVEDSGQLSLVVDYVPSWLKFSYLSVLLEESLANITELFEQGQLVDFEVDELVRLVRALFADTALRTNAINKITSGHPVQKYPWLRPQQRSLKVATAASSAPHSSYSPRPDPFALVAPELSQIRTDLVRLLGSAHPGLDEIASYYFLRPSKQLRPLLILLFSRATNGLGRDWPLKLWASEQARPGGRAEDLDTTLSRPHVLNDWNPSIQDKTTLYDPAFSLLPPRITPKVQQPPSSLFASAEHKITSPAVVLPTQMRLAQIVEMVHAASLLHDDVIDGSPLRRGSLSAPEAFGNKFAVLGGNFILGRASAALARLGDPEATQLIASVIANLVEGEILQMQDVHSIGGDTLAVPSSQVAKNAWTIYLQKTYMKTASLMAKGARSAVVLGGCADGEIYKEVAYAYGRNLGIAFQLVDDVLDYEAVEETLGKPGGADLQLGLATGPALYAWEEHAQMGPLIERKFSRPGDVELARDLVRKSSGVERTRALAIAYATQARDVLQPLPESEARAALEALTDRVIKRKS